MINPDRDWELRGPDDELAGLVLAPRGNREAARLLAREQTWRVTPAGGSWKLLAIDEATGEPAALFTRRRLLPGGDFLVSGGARLRLARGRRRGSPWSLLAPDGSALAGFAAPRARHREQALRFTVHDRGPMPELLVPFAAWIVIELHAHEKRLWRSSRRDDPDRFGGVWGDGGDGGGGGGGD